ncbi:hypothetical protein [Agromyces seonyuensis]|uniref:Uncharacterized protein n=1 Tax=Agromyces seonyuensis TaxID=2662446 RepID=A0A6I4NZD9_9MICO|nr:hypothetical protein [Agromyces seonyuensis]MWB99683.1 hypothetical protein [Agromyces seonyuensis]
MTNAAGWVLRPDEIRASAIFTDQSRLVRVRLWAPCPDSTWALGFALVRGDQNERRLRLRLLAEGGDPATTRSARGVRREAEAIVECRSAREVVVELPDGTETVVPVSEPAGRRRVPLAAG